MSYCLMLSSGLVWLRLCFVYCVLKIRFNQKILWPFRDFKGKTLKRLDPRDANHCVCSDGPKKILPVKISGEKNGKSNTHLTRTHTHYILYAPNNMCVRARARVFILAFQRVLFAENSYAQSGNNILYCTIRTYI